MQPIKLSLPLLLIGCAFVGKEAHLERLAALNTNTVLGPGDTDPLDTDPPRADRPI